MHHHRLAVQTQAVIAQVSSTCKKLAAAAAELLLLPSVPGISLAYSPVPPRLLSHLLLRWAPRPRGLELDSNFLFQPGYEAFVASAGRLQEVHVLRSAWSSNMACVLSTMPSVVRIVCHDPYTYGMPASFPPALRELYVDFSFCPHGHQSAQRLITSLGACRVHLRTLELILGSRPLMAGTTVLPKLQKLSISFTVQATSADLTWLRTQPCEELYLTVTIRSQDHLQQAQAVQQIQHLQVTSLSLIVQTAFSAVLQNIWGQLSLCRTVSIDILDPHKSKLELAALPMCSMLALFAQGYDHDEVIVHWAAARGWVHHLAEHLCGHAISAFRALRYLDVPPSALQAVPVQVHVGMDTQVIGLPAACVSRIEGSNVLRHALRHVPAEMGSLLVFVKPMG